MELSTIFMNRLSNSEGAIGTAADTRNRRSLYSGTNFNDFIAPAKSDNSASNARMDRSDIRNQQKNEFKKSTEKARNNETKPKRNETEADASRRSSSDNSVKERDNGIREQSKTADSTEPTDKNIKDDAAEDIEDVKDGEVTSHLMSILNALIASDNEIKSKLSELLNVTESQIDSALNELNISPLDLLDKANLSNFMQEVMNIQDPVQLLSIPGISKVYEDINTLLSGYSDQAESLKNMNLDGMAALTDQVAQETSGADNAADAMLDQYAENQANSLGSAISGKTAESSVAGSQYASGAAASIKSIFQILQTKVAGIKDLIQTDSLNGAAAVDAIVQAEQQTENPLEINLALNDDRGDEFLDQNADMFNDSQPVHTNNVQSNENSSFAEKIRNESARNINHADVVKQIIEKLKVEIRGNVTEMKLTLKPEHLGDVTLKVQTQNGIVTAQFLAENQRIKEIIESNFNQLRDVLKEQGINVSQLTVSVGGQEAQGQDSGGGYQQHESSGAANRTIGVVQDSYLEDEVEDDSLDEISSSRVNYTV